jgi:hypothetical protein
VGFFKDMRNLQQATDQLTPVEHRGMMGGFRAMKNGATDANQVLGELGGEHLRTQQLMSSGRVGRAEITAIRDTGTTVNENPQVEFDLQVSVDGGIPYPAQHRQIVSRFVVGTFQPGATVPVRVDPADPQSLLIG